MKRSSASLVYDLVALLGLLLVAAGVWWIYPPLALLVGGLAAAGIGLAGARAEATSEVIAQARQSGQLAEDEETA